MPRFDRHKWWILTVLLTVPLLALAAGVPNVFSPGTVISSSQVNDNFKNLADRVTALETAVGHGVTATVVLSNEPGDFGPVGRSKAFTTAGGALVLIVSGSAWSDTQGAALDVVVQLDGSPIGHLKAFTNEGFSHKALPTQVFRVAALPAGSHNLGVLHGNAATTTDANDYFSATVIELGR
jgi:hypothetical protein